MNREQANLVLEIASSGIESLRHLAELTGLDPFTFYQGADLRGLNLAHQDLTGLSFFKADLRFANVNGIKYDLGCFNGAELDKSQEWLTDKFEFYAADILNHPADEILVFCRIRPHILEACIAEVGMNYALFSNATGVSSGALQKARRGEVVAQETAGKIINTCQLFKADLAPRKLKTPFLTQLLRQPNFQIVSDGLNMPFKHVSRARLLELSKMREEILSIRRMMHGNDAAVNWRDTPNFIEL